MLRDADLMATSTISTRAGRCTFVIIVGFSISRCPSATSLDLIGLEKTPLVIPQPCVWICGFQSWGTIDPVQVQRLLREDLENSDHDN